MTKKKKKGRVRQTRTSWQKTFDPHPGMLQPFSWSSRLPEFLHISIALVDNDYQKVKSDFYQISNSINLKHKIKIRFHFNLSHTIKLIKEDISILNEINNTCFKNAFEQILLFYNRFFEINLENPNAVNAKSLLLGYKQILDGRADTSILCKYLMMQYHHANRQDPFGLYNFNKKEEILTLENVSMIMASFPPSVGLSENIDLEFCQNVWTFNFLYAPFMPPQDDTKKEEEHFAEMKIEELTTEFKKLYTEFRDINMVIIYPKPIAEINMGFVSRICNLSLDVIEFVRLHKGEIAELVFRTILENFIVASWLLKRKDPKLHQRFREFSTGRERFFGEKLAEQIDEPAMKEEAYDIIDKAIKDAGVREFEVATERGDIFELNIAQMATEVWGEDNINYFLYKRLSEVTHGQWRVIAKYHLSKSLNPMQNGLYSYNENNNRFAGLVPAFISLGTSIDILRTIMTDIEDAELDTLRKNLDLLYKNVWESYMAYYNKYINKSKENNNTSSGEESASR
jgi:hypothetical protein